MAELTDNERLHLCRQYDGDYDLVEVNKPDVNKAISLTRLEEMLSGIIGTINHEGNQPLCCVIGYSELLLQMKDLPDDVRNYIELINLSGNHLNCIIKTVSGYLKQGLKTGGESIHTIPYLNDPRSNGDTRLLDLEMQKPD